jgi:hypothetical protein
MGYRYLLRINYRSGLVENGGQVKGYSLSRNVAEIRMVQKMVKIPTYPVLKRDRGPVGLWHPATLLLHCQAGPIA